MKYCFTETLKNKVIMCVLRRRVRAPFLHLLWDPPGTALGPPIRKNKKTYMIPIVFKSFGIPGELSLPSLLSLSFLTERVRAAEVSCGGPKWVGWGAENPLSEKTWGI